MGKYISFGRYNIYYKYIILSCTFYSLNYYIISGNLNEDLISLEVISKDTQRLYEHFVINDCFNYIGIFIISFILYKFKEENIDSASEISLFNKINIKENEEKKYVSFLNLSFILIFWITISHIINIIYSLMIPYYWMFELLFICLIYSKLYKIKIYNHQKIGIIINSLSCLIFNIFLYFINLTNQNNYNSDDLNTKYKWLIPISIFIFLFFTFSKSYIFIKLKFYMEIKFISPIKLLILYGILGFIFSSIACIIETSFKCIGSEKEFFCTVTTNLKKEKNYDTYIDNFFIFIHKFSLLESKDITIEILIIFIEIIVYYYYIYFGIFIINYLTPMHYIFTNLCNDILNEFIQLIRDIIEKGKSVNKNIDKVFFLRISIYICSLVGFMIYLEIIEFNFCNLNYNLRKYIIERANKEINEDKENKIDEGIINDDRIDDQNLLLNNNVELSFNKKK